MQTTVIMKQEDLDKKVDVKEVASAASWAKLRFLPEKDQNIYVYLSKNFATFGRASLLDAEAEGFKFTASQRFSPDVISRQHFTITRMACKAGVVNMNPPILTCCSINGMSVNNDELLKGQKRILLDGDQIKIVGFSLFIFEDLRTFPDYFPKRIRGKFFIGEFLGKGCYGKVQMIHDAKSLQKFAIKVVKLELKNGKPDENKKRQIENEIDVMMPLNHPNLMTLIDKAERSKSLFLIMDLMDMDLTVYLMRFPDERVSEDEARFFFYQICKGVEFVHSKSIIHRDLKTDNILVKIHQDSQQVQLRIGDFGFSKYDPNGEFYTPLGTECFAAPEIFELLETDNSTPFTTKADVWSLGCVLFKMLTGKLAFHPYEENVRDKITTAKFNRMLIKKTSRNIVDELLQVNPSNRPAVSDVIKFPWFNFPDTSSRVKLFVDDLKLPADYNTL